MEYRRLGASGLTVSRLCFGTLTMAPMQRNLAPEFGAELLIYANKRGVDFLDTADLYDNYSHIRLALKSGADYRISTKAYCWDTKTASAALERAFKGLDREYVDLFMLHEQESYYTLRGHEEALDYLMNQKALGRIGAVGISTHFAPCVKAAARFDQIEVIHPLINMSGIGIQGGTRDEMIHNIEFARDNGRGILVMKALGGGHLIKDAKEALEYILEQPWADSIAVGMQSFEEIDANVALFEGASDADEKLERLNGVKREIIVQDWCEGCGRCAARCKQRAISIENGRAAIDKERCVFCGYCASACPQFCIKVI